MKYELDIVGTMRPFTSDERYYVEDIIRAFLDFNIINFTSVTLNAIEGKVDGNQEQCSKV